MNFVEYEIITPGQNAEVSICPRVGLKSLAGVTPDVKSKIK